MLLAVGIATAYLRASDRLAAKVDRILKQDMTPGNNKWQAGMDELWALGPDIIPHLAAEARFRDSLLARYYPALWKKIPARLRHYLPPPVDQARLRQAAMRAIAEFGPLAVRRAASEVIAGVSKSDDRYNNYAVQCLRWLAPESAPALAAFQSELTSTNGRRPPFETTMGSVVYQSFWKSMPGIVPLLTNHLGNAGEAYIAAIALAGVGSNAAPAIPALIQTLDMGAAGPFPDPEAVRMHRAEVFSNPIGLHAATLRQDDKGMNHNRAMAALALGRIGIGNAEVCAALARAWNFPDAWVRKNAAQASAMLGPSMSNQMPGLLTGLTETDNAALDKKLLAIGKIGPGARAALETLRELSNCERLRSLVADPDAKVAGESIEDLAVSAKIAICRIDPEEGRPYIPDIADKIGYSWEPVQFLIEPSPLSNDVVRAVEPSLEQTDSSRQSIAAYVILSHDQKHPRALETLRRNESVGGLNERLLAGRLLFESLGETNGLCSLLAEAFNAPQSVIGQNAGHLADEMGPAARPALASFKAALWHKDVFVRQQAGMLLIKLAPEDLPINGAK